MRPEMNFDFSLILCTLNRTKEVDDFLCSLAEQPPELNLELIVVDQNGDERLDAVLEPYRKRFALKRIRTSPGLSRARNLGLRQASGRIIAFPDDDCVYPPDLLARIAAAFSEDAGMDGLSTLVTDSGGQFSAGGRMYRHPCRITARNVWWCGVSPSIFVRREAAAGVFFDETLGVGSGTIFGSGEETDYLLALMEAGKRLEYRPDLVVLHPRFGGPWLSRRGMLYGCGMGRVLRKHGRSFPTAAYYAGLQLVRAAQSFAMLRFGKMCFH